MKKRKLQNLAYSYRNISENGPLFKKQRDCIRNLLIYFKIQVRIVAKSSNMIVPKKWLKKLLSENLLKWGPIPKLDAKTQLRVYLK